MVLRFVELCEEFVIFHLLDTIYNYTNSISEYITALLFNNNSKRRRLKWVSVLTYNDKLILLLHLRR